jgi:uncharacterized protein YbjT (DUF2867 family)
MILLTGGTGFIGHVLARHLVASGHPVRMLLRPAQRTPRLPTGVPVEVAVVSLGDVRALRAALHGIDTIYHLAGVEHRGVRANLQGVDIDGTRNLLEAAVDARVERFFYLSHLDADRASAFPVLKTKGIAEEHIRKSKIPYTILRSAVVFGLNDHFTTSLALLLAGAPGIFPIPRQGDMLLQPLWVEDLVTCLVWALDEPATLNQTYEVGGGEYFTFHQVLELIMSATKRHRFLVPFSTPMMRALTVTFETVFPRFPTSSFWMDYLAVNRTCPVDSVPRIFGLMPARFSSRLGHLRGIKWGREFWKYIFTGD